MATLRQRKRKRRTMKSEKENDEIIFLIRGIANGMESEMTFKKKGEHWKLMKFNS